MKAYQAIDIADRWERLTGVPLRPFVEILPPDASVVPDVGALEAWLQPAEGESVRECLGRRHGNGAVEIIDELLGA